MTTTSCRTPEQVGLTGVQLQTVGQHPRGDVIDTYRQAHLEVCDRKWSARAVYLGVVGLEMWPNREVMPFYQTD